MSDGRPHANSRTTVDPPLAQATANLTPDSTTANQSLDASDILDRGFVIIRNAIPPEELEQVRKTFDLFLERAEERSRDDLNVGWNTHRVPHPGLFEFFDDDTASLFDLLVSDHILDANCRLMGGRNACLNSAQLFKEPANKLKAPFQFHRDFNPRTSLPLRGLQIDHQANATGHLTWNISLYDDESLWVIPGSNKRRNTDVEEEFLNRPSMLSDEPPPGAIPVGLAAGDAAAFDATMLHSGSNDTCTLRRTFNVAYRGFGTPVFPHNRGTTWRPDVAQRISSSSTGQFARFLELLDDELDTLTHLFRAVIDADEPAFHQHLASIHPGEQGRIAGVVQLHKPAYTLWIMSRREQGSITQKQFDRISIEHPDSTWRTIPLFNRFTHDEVESLWQRFIPLDRALRATEPEPGELSAPEYDPVDMPASFDLDDFISSWEMD